MLLAEVKQIYKIGAVPESTMKYSLLWVIYTIKTEEWSYIIVDD